MIQSATKYQISDLFNPDAKIKYVVPKFQREYVWGKEDWDNLFNDLIVNEKGHFLGSIICINKGSDALEISPLEVIDGQQRLTTISLLYMAIYSKLLTFNFNDDDFITLRTNLKNRFIQKSKKGDLKLELSYQNNNFNDFKYILNELKLINFVGKKQYVGNRRIYKAYKYYKNKIEDFDNDEIVSFLDKINSAWLVKIEVDSHADAFILFESLNNRGEPLSAIDLIKNKLLAELENEEISIDDAFEEWVEVINYLPDYVMQERFLRQYYNAFRYKDKVKTKNFSIATKSNLIKIYESLIESDVKSIFDEIIDKSKIYNKLIKPAEDNECYQGLCDLINLGAAPAYTYLLYLFSEHNTNLELIQSSIDFLVKYTVRRNLTDYPNTRDLDRMFINLIDECEIHKDNLNFSIVKDFLTKPNRYSNSETFINKLKGDIYEENAPVARFILCKIDESHQTKETSRDLWKKNEKGSFIWTIEHVLPETENLSSDWINMIANGDKQKARDYQILNVHKLGNLTLSAYNSNLYKSRFDVKQNLTDKNGDYIGYKNGIYLNKDLANKTKWTIQDIEERSELLVKEALNIFDNT